MASDKLITNQWERDYSKMHPIHKEYCEALDESMDALDKAMNAAGKPGGNIPVKRELNHIKYTISTYKDRAEEEVKI